MDIVEWEMSEMTSSLDLEDVQGALCEDGAEGGRQAELYQTLQMSHFLCFGFLTSLFQSAAVYQGKASVEMCLISWVTSNIDVCCCIYVFFNNILRSFFPVSNV